MWSVRPRSFVEKRADVPRCTVVTNQEINPPFAWVAVAVGWRWVCTYLVLRRAQEYDSTRPNTMVL